MFGQIDTDGDGQLGSDELSTFQKQQISTMRSALLNLQESFGGDGGQAEGVGQAHHGHRRYSEPARPSDAAATPGQSGTSTVDAGSTVEAGESSDPISAFFSAVDTDRNGAISKPELSSFVSQIFSRLGSPTQTGSSSAATSRTV